MAAAPIDVAVVGATGVLGEALLDGLSTAPFPLGRVYALASDRTAGGEVDCGHRRLTVERADPFDFRQAQLVLLAAPAAVAAGLGPKLREAGCLVVDASGSLDTADWFVPGRPRAGVRALRLPLPGVTQALSVLLPLSRLGVIEALEVLELRAVSGRGMAAVRELGQQTADVLNFRNWSPQAYPQQIAFNLLPSMGDETDGMLAEEAVAVAQVQHQLPGVAVHWTQAEMPVFYGFGQHLTVRLSAPVTPRQVTECLAATEGLCWGGEAAEDRPSPVTHASGDDQIHLSRLRLAAAGEQTLRLWSVADNVRAAGVAPMLRAARLLVDEYL